MKSNCIEGSSCGFQQRGEILEVTIRRGAFDAQQHFKRGRLCRPRGMLLERDQQLLWYLGIGRIDLGIRLRLRFELRRGAPIASKHGSRIRYLCRHPAARKP
jgi:hypothetical protein